MTDITDILLNRGSMKIIKEKAMNEALRLTNGNQVRAARKLGIARSTMHNYARTLDVNVYKAKKGNPHDNT